MTNVAKLANQSEPEPEAESEQGRSPSEVRLRDGKSFLLARAEVIPGFLVMELENKTPVPLVWVSVVVIPSESRVRLYSRLAPFSLPPHTCVCIPVAYTSDSACQYTILVMYRRDLLQAPGTFIHVCQTKAYLIPTPENAFQRVATWHALAPKLARRELPLPPGVSPLAVITGLGTYLGGVFTPLSGNAGDVMSSWWGCIDPPMMASFASGPDASVVLFGADAGVLDRVRMEVTKWLQPRARDVDVFELGILITTLRDGLVMGAKADHIRPEGIRAARIAEGLGLHVPLLAKILDIIASRESLDQLTNPERQEYERALAEIETQVGCRPS